VVSLKSGKIIVLCKITLLSDPVTYGTLEVMVDWHYSKCVQACPNCIGCTRDVSFSFTCFAVHEVPQVKLHPLSVCAACTGATVIAAGSEKRGNFMQILNFSFKTLITLKL